LKNESYRERKVVCTLKNVLQFNSYSGNHFAIMIHDDDDDDEGKNREKKPKREALNRCIIIIINNNI